MYGELHRIASREMRREHGEHTVQTTAVAHEVYLRLLRLRPDQLEGPLAFSSRSPLSS